MLNVLIAFFIILFSLPYLNKVWKAWQLPGPIALPYIGNGIQLTSKTPVELLEYIGVNMENSEKFVRYWVGPTLTCITKNPLDSEV